MRPSNASFLSTERAVALLTCLLLASSGHAQDACASDDECAEDLVCSRVLFGVDCESGSCLDVLEQGFCAEPEPEPLRCDDRGQCPQPLYCDDANEAGPLCAYVELMCGSDDGECPTGFMCVDLEPLGGCSRCDEEGTACTPAPCAENMLNVCSPIAVACTEDTDCEAGFVCREIGAFDLQTGWDETLVGTRGCLSVGLLAVGDGFVQGGDDLPPDPGEPTSGGAGGASGASATGGTGSGGSTGGAGAGAAGMSAMAGASGATASGDGGGDSSGCTVREARSSRALSLAVMLTLLTAALLLRRWPVG